MRKPTTGEPYAGEPHVRFGGRGGESLSYPYQSPGTRGQVWMPAFAGMTLTFLSHPPIERLTRLADVVNDRATVPCRASQSANLVATNRIEVHSLGGFPPLPRDQNSNSRLIPCSIDVVVVDNRQRMLIEIVAAAIGVVHELLGQQYISGSCEGFYSSGDADDVGDLGLSDSFQLLIQSPKAAVGSDSHLQMVSRVLELAEQPLRCAQQ
jgi:hypothetical protein